MGISSKYLAGQVMASGGVVASTLMDSLIYAYKFDEASTGSGAVTRNDSHGTNHLTDNNTVKSEASPRGNSARLIAANSEYFSVSANSNLDTGDIAYHGSVRVRLSNKTGNHFIVNKDTVGAGGREYSMFYYQTNDVFLFAAYDGTSSVGVVEATTFGSPSLNTWYTVEYYHDPVANLVGIAVTPDGGAVGAFDTTATSGAPAVTTSPVWFGHRQTAYLEGNLDTAYFWKKILSSAERTELHSGTYGNPYPFDGTGYLYSGMDAYLIAGQSNASGRGTTLNTYSGTPQGILLDNTYQYATDIDDATDEETGQIDTVSQDVADKAAGSVWPDVASDLADNASRKMMFVPCSLGGSSVTDWQPGADRQNRSTLYGSMVYRALCAAGAGATLKGVLWWQGERDAADGMPEATYNGHLDTLANAINTDLGIPLIACKFQSCTSITDADEDKINDAIGTAWGDNANVEAGPDLTGLTADNDDGLGVHLISDANIASAYALWVTAIEAL